MNIDFPLFVDELRDGQASVFIYTLEFVEGVPTNAEIGGAWGFVPAISSLALICPEPFSESVFSESDFDRIFNSVFDAGCLITPVYAPQTIRIPANLKGETGSVLRLGQRYAERLFADEQGLELDLRFRNSDAETLAFLSWQRSLIGDGHG